MRRKTNRTSPVSEVTDPVMGLAAREIAQACVFVARRLLGNTPREAMRSGLKGIKKNGHPGDIALGAAIASGMAAGRSLFEHPGMQATMRAAGRDLFGLDPENHAGDDIAEAQADTIVRHLAQRAIHPTRIAVDGLPGSGKSTLAGKLARRLDMRHLSLDHTDMTRPVDLRAPAVVFEHHRLLRTQNLDRFDALIYLDLPVSEILERLQQRERGAYLMALFNFDQMKLVGDVAFGLCDGEVIEIGGGPKLKLRPPQGYRMLENTERLARQRNLDIAGLNREAQILMLVSGRPRQGLRAYLNQNEMHRGLAAAAGAAVNYLKWRRT